MKTMWQYAQHIQPAEIQKDQHGHTQAAQSP